VQNGLRFYYGGDDLPEVVEVAEHHFIERQIINSWRIDMNVAWYIVCFEYSLLHSDGGNRKSASNCARLYSLAHSGGGVIPADWPFKPVLKGDHVYTGFILLSLLEDYPNRHGVLTVPHDGDHGKRFKQAICDRNIRIKLYGQPEILHACGKCVRVYPEQNKCEFDISTSRLFMKKHTAVSVVMMDGITIGHPRCASDGCKSPLATARDHFCPGHQNNGNICVVNDCKQLVVGIGKRTCGDPVHQNVEKLHEMRGQSRFQLQERLKHARVAHPTDSIAVERAPDEVIDEEAVDEEFIVVDERDTTQRSRPSITTTTNFPQLQVKKRIKATFRQKQTHNEQVLVAPCGVILARETFYGAEGISTCAVSLVVPVSFEILTIFLEGIYQMHLSNPWANARSYLLRQ
jgi:hypothetical protein